MITTQNFFTNSLEFSSGGVLHVCSGHLSMIKHAALIRKLVAFFIFFPRSGQIGGGGGGGGHQ